MKRIGMLGGHYSRKQVLDTLGALVGVLAGTVSYFATHCNHAGFHVADEAQPPLHPFLLTCPFCSDSCECLRATATATAVIETKHHTPDLT